MPIISITAADLAKTANIEAKWYSAKLVKTHPPVTAASGKSVNYVFDFEIENAVTNGGAPVPGKQIPYLLNSELLGKMAPMAEALTGAKMDPGQIDTDQLVGKRCDVKVGQRNYNGQLIDEIQAFVPLGVSKSAAAPF